MRQRAGMQVLQELAKPIWDKAEAYVRARLCPGCLSPALSLHGISWMPRLFLHAKRGQKGSLEAR